MAKKKVDDEDYKSLLVYFGDSEDDYKLFQRLKKRCKFVTPSTFFKEAAEEKLDNEERYQEFLRNGGVVNTTTPSYQKQNTEELPIKPVSSLDESVVDGILDAFDID